MIKKRIRKEIFFLMAVFRVTKLRIKNERQNFFHWFGLTKKEKKVDPQEQQTSAIKIFILMTQIR
jgi:hypothetical protein